MSGLVKSSFIEGRIESVTRWSESHLSFGIAASLPPFKAGQFIRLQMSIDGEQQARTYSLVNAPGQQLLEVYFNTVPSGVFSNALARLEAGDRLEVSQPANGFFVLDEIPDSRDLWMVATGTGIGPYVSMLREGKIWERFERCVLVHSAGKTQELAYRDELLLLQQSRPAQFTYVAAVTKEPFSEGLNERITAALQAGALEQRTSLTIAPETSHVMLCGNHHMLNDMKKLLGERGMQKHLRHKPGHITTEQYF